MDDEKSRFVSLVADAVQALNRRASYEGEYLSRQGGSKMEPVALEALRGAAQSNGFAVGDIQLVSGSRFPDIIVGRRFGVEVKTTKDDSWRSIGSSIVESTRIEGVEDVYLLFGKLGGDVRFKALPYQMCLSGIAVTHMPRYQIDMDVCEDDVIFNRLDIPYNEFCKLDEREKVRRVRNYYKKLGEESGKDVMPWWIGEDTATKMNLMLYSSLSQAEKDELRARAFVIFPSLFGSHYKKIAFWLCNRYSLINHNVRDGFSAGGQVNEIGRVTFNPPIPKIIKNFYSLRERVVALLSGPDKELLDDIADYWDFSYNPGDIFGSWKTEVNRIFSRRGFQLSIETILAI